MATLQTLRAAAARAAAVLQRHPSAAPLAAVEVPLRAELFNAEQMERHGKTLAEQHSISAARGRDQLLQRLGENEGVLQAACTLLMQAARQAQRITPAGEWLLDNFYLIEEQIHTARAHFSKGYGRELPVLASGASQGLARVYDLALEAIAHGEGRIDPENLNRFVLAYQTVSELTLGELWAIPIMLRLALLENLRRIAARVAESMDERNRACGWAEKMVEVAERDPKSLILVIADMARASPELGTTFVAELARRLQGHSAALALPLTWIAQRLSESELTIEQMVQSETQSQAVNQVCISNSIASLRLLNALDWRAFVEAMSGVERKLRQDPQGVYARMDFNTRDSYRHVVETLARRSLHSESEVARKAVQLAHHALATRSPPDPQHPGPHDHVGYYLLGAGRGVLERALQVQLGLGASLRRWLGRAPLAAYLLALALPTLGFAALLAFEAQRQGLGAAGLLAAQLPALLVASQLGLTLVNWAATLLVTPRLLPRMDFAQGMDPGARTLVVVPTLLSSVQGVQRLVEDLEVRFLANQDPCLHYALLTDWCDAEHETEEDDAALLEQAMDGIRALNSKYPGTQQDTFFLMHRPRLWNPAEQVWMCYERKRGKLGALNALLRGTTPSGFSHVLGHTEVLRQVRFVITLDTDTQLQRDSARRFAATLAHPLNRAHFDAARQRVVAGYGILQPLMAVSLHSTNRSRYASLMGTEPGVDPYTRAISDVYQDLFQEGSFIGKGIYDVDAFELALKDRFPENRILSHDLLEGCHARCGLISDVQLYDDYPARYDSDVARRSRWMRGDWQIAAWLLPRVPAAQPGARQRNPLSALSRWKILDNLRRSLVPLCLLALLLLGWWALADARLWTLYLLAPLLLPPLLSGTVELLRKPHTELPWRQHARAVRRTLRRQLAQAAVALALLPHEAWYASLAIGRTLVRMLFTHRHLLEWRASDAANRQGADPPERVRPGGALDLLRSYARMAVLPLLALAVALGQSLPGPSADNALAAAPFVLLWLLAPVLAWWLSRPLLPPKLQLNTAQTRFLRKLARRTWSFFETYVGPEDHWLPPDNYQEHPVAVLAHRTSPTNMGLALLSNVAACDFGYISVGTLLARTEKSLQAMQQLERHAGHFYNWYDTRTLAPLAPRYLSSVDSGNLAGLLLTLRPALLQLADAPVFQTQCLQGLADSADLLADALPRHSGMAPNQALLRLGQSLDAAQDAPPLSCAQALDLLQDLEAQCSALLPLLQADTAAAADANALRWAHSLQAHSQDLLHDLRTLCSSDMAEAPLALYAQAIPSLRALAAAGSGTAQARLDSLEPLAQQAAALAQADYELLYDRTRHLMVVGYNVDDHRRDSCHYDLLASEARLCSFVAIAQSEVPQDNWFALGRMLTAVGDAPTLLSWSGSMFEYLMPNLVMPSYANTLLEQTNRAMVQRQIAYGEQHGVPWGISESGYNTVDAALNYQYRAFGVPGLGLKRGLADDLVIAPYASALALMVLPDAACRNLQRLATEGLLGLHGLYEAVDYTPARLPRGQSGAVVRSYMAHHQGMSLLAFGAVLLDQPMQKRFASEPLFQAIALLLQERVPVGAVLRPRAPELSDIRSASIGQISPLRVLRNPDTPTPEVQLLSNGRYQVMLTQAGAGYSRWRDQAITRWHEDSTRDHWGSFCYLCDVSSGAVWSVAHQPTLARADHYEAIFTEGRAEFRRRDQDFETYTEIVVSPEDDMELRRTRITNRSRSRRTVEITSYAEVVLAPMASDALHQTFSNLFVQTELLRERQAILCHRRARSETEQPLWLFHLMAVHGANAQSTSYETDRRRFIGRTRSLVAPQALAAAGLLQDSAGSVLDPIVAIRQRITLEPQQVVTVDVATGVASAREGALRLVDKYRDRHLADRVFDLASTHAWVNLQQINASEGDAQLFARLAGSVLYANPVQRAPAAVLAHNRRGQSGLWGYGISGDLPMVLLQIGSADNLDLVRQLVQAHAYWRLKGLAVDLVIWNEDHGGYRQLLQDQILGLIAAGIEANLTDRPGGIFVRLAEHMSPEDRILFQTVARIVITDTQGSLKSQAYRHQSRELREMPAPLVPLVTPQRAPAAQQPESPVLVDKDLQFFNGRGGFSPDGREYVIVTQGAAQTTPLPWVNVIANARFGTVISESGSAYTWSENAHEFRYTPWNNDPVCDSPGEALYLRDEESGAFWSPTPLPCGGTGPFVTRHGFGYSVFTHTHDGIASELTVFVEVEAAIKFSRLRVRNQSARSRKLSATGYVDWVLGDLQAKTAMHVSTEIDPHSGAILARNAYSPEFGDRMAFFDAAGATRAPGVTVCADRREFIGRNGNLRRPAALRRVGLSNRVGAGLDPCAAVQVPFELQPGQEREIVFRLGAAGRRGLDDARVLVQHLRDPEALQGALQAVHDFWGQTLGAVQVHTPDAALNVLANGWLLYQTLACRLWARTGFYQSGGAFGFRDQLQDCMALVHAAPHLLREQLLRCAARQFSPGDVQHWWHPPQGRGVRTHCSDDYLWLPLATCRYVQASGDTAVLQENLPFLQGRAVNPEEDSYYDLPLVAEEWATLYQHCVRALRHGLRFGVHGLPLMGSGDWNDGMNLVGLKGQGESVWLGFFLFAVLQRFSPLARAQGDAAFADECLAQAEELRRNIALHAWDGQWYRRAYFDDGTALGSAANAECQIDSIAQSWAVLSGAGDAARIRSALDALDQRLVRRPLRLIQLLDPPFDQSPLNPGYIKGYVPGVRENGGQYTHAAIWAVMAFAEAGQTERAWECFDLINPVRHALDAEGLARYQVEPYVVAADVYAVAPHEGRGGWTWYTGSASWMYRLIVESLLGLRREGQTLHLTPRLPAHWSGVSLHYRYGSTVYAIEVSRSAPVDIDQLLLDGVLQSGNSIALQDDQVAHRVELQLRALPAPP